MGEKLQTEFVGRAAARLADGAFTDE